MTARGREGTIASAHARSSRDPARVEESRDMILRRSFIVYISTLVIVGGGVLVFTRRSPVMAPPVLDVPVVVPPTSAERRWIDGQPIAENAIQPIAAAVVIDNAPEARPQSGIADTPFVIELPVEGGRTRFIAFFVLDAAVSEIGPVRSARPYFATIAHAFHAPLVHVGGSPETLAFLRTSGWAHVNQYYDPPFRRVDFRSIPFNVYTAMSGLAAFIRDHGWENAATRAYNWGITESTDAVAPAAVESSVGQSVHIGWSGNSVVWTYDVTTKQYARTQGDRAHLDADGKQVTATNVIVLKIGTKVLDEIGRLSLQFPTDMAPGGADVLQGGKRASGSWAFHDPEKLPKDERAGILLTAPLKLEPGTTWIELVPDGTLVE